MVAGAGRENGMETPMHENPEWEKARQALASISKAGAAGSSKASSNGPVASSQVRRPRGPGTLVGSTGIGTCLVSSRVTSSAPRAGEARTVLQAPRGHVSLSPRCLSLRAEAVTLWRDVPSSVPGQFTCFLVNGAVA